MAKKKASYSLQDIKDIRHVLIERRNKCFDLKEFDADGAVVLSHTIKLLAELIES